MAAIHRNLAPAALIEGSLTEIRYALDTLKADGIAMWTNYGDRWLGHPSFAPVFEELNRRKVTVFTHPKAANCCGGNLVQDVPPPIVEYGTDTTRAVASLVLSGASSRYADLRFIFSHAGGTTPFLIERFVNYAQDPAAAARADAPMAGPKLRDPVAEIRKFYYDTAQSANRVPMLALKAAVPMSQILFGTDFPYRHAAEYVTGLRRIGVFSGQELAAIDRGNAARLLPQLGA
jgi:6-methylsalicylate decarboxylase